MYPTTTHLIPTNRCARHAPHVTGVRKWGATTNPCHQHRKTISRTFGTLHARTIANSFDAVRDLLRIYWSDAVVLPSNVRNSKSFVVTIRRPPMATRNAHVRSGCAPSSRGAGTVCTRNGRVHSRARRPDHTSLRSGPRHRCVDPGGPFRSHVVAAVAVMASIFSGSVH